MSFLRLRSFFPLAFGIAASILAAVLYYFFGYGYDVLLLWVLGPISAAYYFFHSSPQKSDSCKLEKRDFLYMAWLLVLFIPVYLWDIYRIPWQINTDEITIMHFMEKLSSGSRPDIFALSEYFYFPSFPFVMFGKLAGLMGGVTLFNVRIVHALSGLLIVLVSYVFFKYLTGSRLFAAGGGVLIGSNHVLIAISRMAMRDNVALLTELAAFALLLRGLQTRSLFKTFLGGTLAGLTLYQYFPGRITALLWALFMLLCLMFFRKEVSLKTFSLFAATAALGFVLVAGPILAAALKTPEYGQGYAREQILLFPEGRELERGWEGKSNAYEAMHINLINGLTAFNKPLHDHGYIYPNYGHGFLDPFTGILIWVGMAVILFKAEKEKEDIFILSGFVFIYLFFAFLTTKNPNYTRTLVILPFIAGLALTALSSIAKFAERMLPRAGVFLFLAALTYVFAANLEVFSDFAQKGLAEGNDVGSTARYIEERKEKPGYSFYVAASPNYPYYSWGNEWQWQTWAGFFAGLDQQVKITPPEVIVNIPKAAPFTIFASREAFRFFEDEVRQAYPRATRYDIKTDGSLAALEVL